MSEYRVISLTTDYGLADGFVAVCHGVIAGRAPQVRVIDISHAVPPGDVRRAAITLAQTVPYLPNGVHVAVVDPGVGTSRHPIAVDTPGGVLVGPDNGLLIWAAEALGGITRVMALTNTEFHRHPVSHTFHGRDIFAPVAAALATGTSVLDLGQPVSAAKLVTLPDPVVELSEDELRAEVLSIDHFGNVQLAADGPALENLGEMIDVSGHNACRGDMFAAAGKGELVVLIDSADRVAICVNAGSAAEALSVGPGDIVRLRTV